MAPSSEGMASYVLIQKSGRTVAIEAQPQGLTVAIEALGPYMRIIVVCSVWLLVVLSWRAQHSVTIGEIQDPHNNLTSFQSNVAVCNFDLFFGLGAMKQNTTEEIECYRSHVVNKNTKDMWEGCPHTMYHMLNSHKGQNVIKCMVYIEPWQDNENQWVHRTTPWTPAQTFAFEQAVGRAVNEWREVLADKYPNDFHTTDHKIELHAIVEPSDVSGVSATSPIRGLGPIRVYNGLCDGASSTLDCFENLTAPFTADKLKAYGIHLVVYFRSMRDDPFLMGQFYHQKLLDQGSVRRCIPDGVHLQINDAFNDPGGRPTQLVQDMFTWSAIIFFPLMALLVMLYRGFSKESLQNLLRLFLLTLISLVLGIACSFVIHKMDPRPAPVVDGQPTRFAIDYYSVSTLLHELGHNLLLNDHYEKYQSEGGFEVLDGVVPRRPFECETMKPVSIMGAENKITKFDRDIVQSMWALLKDENDTYPKKPNPCEMRCSEGDCQYPPECNVSQTSRTPLSDGRESVQKYMSYIGTIVEVVTAVIVMTLFGFGGLFGGRPGWRGRVGPFADFLAVLSAGFFVAHVFHKSNQVDRCIGQRQSFAKSVMVSSLFVLIPISILLLRLAIVLLQAAKPKKLEGKRSRTSVEGGGITPLDYFVTAMFVILFLLVIVAAVVRAAIPTPVCTPTPTPTPTTACTPAPTPLY